MTPLEFVARVADLFEFDLGGNFSRLRPTSLDGLAHSIKGNRGRNFIDVDGYEFRLQMAEALGHTIIQASMTGEDFIRGRICYTIQDYDIATEEDGASSKHMLESWRLPVHLKCQSDKIASMLAFLVLKTDYKIKNKTNAS